MGQKNHHTHLSLEERRQIYLMLGRKMSACEIAKKLGRHHSTIYREINRNMYFEEDDHKMNGYYLTIMKPCIGLMSLFMKLHKDTELL